MNIVIIHYNTPELTEAAIRSVMKHKKNDRFFVFDNSDKTPFNPSGVISCNVTVFDNTSAQLLDFNAMLQTFPDKELSADNNYASFKHCCSVQYIMDCCVTQPFILMDSDVLIKKDITTLCDVSKVFVGQIKPHHSRFGTVERVMPQLCFINTPMAKQHGIRFYNPQKMFALSHRRPDNAYDTGAWFLEDCKQHHLPYSDIDITAYINHLRHASWKTKDAKAWLKTHAPLWE